MKMSKCQYRIGDLSKQLNVEKFVIRFWEKELGIKPKRSKGGQRFYQEKDFQTFSTVKTLLYDKKFTIAGAKKELSKVKHSITSQAVVPTEKTVPKTYQQRLIHFKKQLLKLKLNLES